jgi:uncharacterized phage protein gp47/JayE
MATSAPSFDDYVALGAAEAKLDRGDLALLEDDVSTMELEAAAAMAEYLTGYAIKQFRDTFLDGAAGDALTEYCDDRYGIQRSLAIAATGQATFARSIAGPAGTLAAGFTLATQKDAFGNEVQYLLDADLDWALNETGSKVVNVICAVEGKVGNTGGVANLVNRMISTPFDPNITLASTTAMAGGDDEESDDDLRARCRQVFTTLRRATLDALEFGAISDVPAVKRATIAEDATGILTLYVSDIDGNSSSTMIANVIAAMRNWRAGGALLNVVGGQVYASGHLAVTVAVTVAVGVALDPLVANIKLAIVAAIQKLKIGEVLYQDLIRTAAKAVDPDNIKKVVVTTPATDLDPGASFLIRTTVADITVGGA